MTPRAQRLAQLNPRPRNRKPHPVVRLESKTEESYLATALDNSGFIIVETLKDKDNRIRGIKFVTEVGTVIVPHNHLLIDASEIISERLTDSSAVIVLVDMMAAKILRDDCGVILENPLPLPEALNRTLTIMQNGEESEKTLGELVFGTTVHFSDYHALVRAITEQEIGYSQKDGWEYHWERPFDECRSMIVNDSRIYIQAYERIGGVLYDLEPGVVEEFYEDLRLFVDDALERLRKYTPSRDALGPKISSAHDVQLESSEHYNEDNLNDTYDFKNDSAGLVDIENIEIDDIQDDFVGPQDSFDTELPDEIDIGPEADFLDIEDVDDVLLDAESSEAESNIISSRTHNFENESEFALGVDKNKYGNSNKENGSLSSQGITASEIADVKESSALNTSTKSTSSGSKGKKKKSAKDNNSRQQQVPLTLFDLDNVIAPSPFDLFTPAHTDDDSEENDPENRR